MYAGRGVGRHCQGLHGSLMGQFARRGFEPAKVEFGLALRLSHALGSQATLRDSFSFRKTSLESGSGALCAPTVGRKGHDRRPISGQPLTEPHCEAGRRAARGLRVPLISRQQGVRSRRDQPYLGSSKPPHIIAAAPNISQAVNAPAAIHIDLSMTRPSSALNVSMTCGPEKFAAPEKVVDEPGAL